jgi:ATP-dependent RNA helicase DDX46/PRP5
LRKGAEIVICTPGRMIDVLCLSNGKVTNLQRVTFVVIDEADRMFDLGFEPQIARILANIRPDRQTVMFSATFPKQIESLAKKILNKPIEIVVGNRGQSCINVQQFVEVRDDSTKLYRLLEILGEYTNDKIAIIIFVDRQIEADELFKELYQLGYMSLVIHGGQDQEDRDFAISDFKSGVRNILISTSVCARGLDVKHCGLVINFKCPNHMEDYVHRVGKNYIFYI